MEHPSGNGTNGGMLSLARILPLKAPRPICAVLTLVSIVT